MSSSLCHAQREILYPYHLHISFDCKKTHVDQNDIYMEIQGGISTQLQTN